MAKYRTCEYCGAHLDHCEPCDCLKNKQEGEQTEGNDSDAA